MDNQGQSASHDIRRSSRDGEIRTWWHNGNGYTTLQAWRDDMENWYWQKWETMGSL